MKRALLLVAALLAAAPARADEAPALAARDTADLGPRGSWSVGVFNPLRYAVRDGLEVEAHPLLFFIAPNALVRIRHGDAGPFRLTGEYGLSLPTPAMRLTQGLAFASWDQSDKRVGWLLVPRAGVVASKGDAQRDVLTARADIAFGLPLSRNDASPRNVTGPVDLLLAPALERFRARMGATYDARLSARWRARAYADLWLVGPPAAAGAAGDISPWTFSAGAGVDFRMTPGTRLTLGAIWYNHDTHAIDDKTFERYRNNDFFPTLDLIWER